MALAIPVGQLADRVGRVPVLLAGYALLFIVYGALLMSSLGYVELILCLVALGGYFAATEGVMTALAGAMLPEKLQASGIGILITVVSIGSLLSSLAFGALWFAIGLQSAVLVFAAALALAILARGAAADALPAGSPAMDSRSKKILAAIVVLCVVGGGAYVAVAALGPNETTTDAQPRRRCGAGPHRPDGAGGRPQGADPQRPRLRARRRASCARSPATSPASGSTTPPGTGSAWASRPPGVEYTASIFDSKLQREHTITLTGLPSRARVSADGRYGAMTVFVTGDSYLSSPTAFSTRTTILDMASGKQVGQLEQFKVEQGRQALRRRRLQLLGRHLRPERLRPLLRDPGHGRRPLPGRRQRQRRIDDGPARRGRVPLALARTASRSPTRAGSATKPAGTCGCSTWRPWRTTRSPRTARSTTRSSGWTTTRWSIPTASTSTRCRPTAAAPRRLLVRDATSPVRLEGSGQELADSQR